MLMLLVLGTNWGLGFTLGKVGVTGGLHPLAYAFWQCFGGGVVLFLIAHWRGQPPPLQASHLRYYLICGVTNIAMKPAHRKPRAKNRMGWITSVYPGRGAVKELPLCHSGLGTAMCLHERTAAQNGFQVGPWVSFR